MAGWIKIPLGKEVGLCPVPKRLYVRWGTQLPSSKGSRAPNFRPMSIVARQMRGSMALDMKVGLGAGHILLDGAQLPLPRK